MQISIQNPDDIRLDPYRSIRERDLTGRHGLFIAEGKTVLAVLARSPHHDVHSVLVLENRLGSLAQILPLLDEQIPVYVVPQAVIDTVAGFHVHRGILALGAIGQTRTAGALLADCGPDALVVVLSDISNHDNAGSVFRNAAAFGADAILLDERCCDPMYRKSIRVSAGGVLQVPWARSGSLEETVSLLQQSGFAIAALSPSGRHDISALPVKGRRALLFGSEGHGLPTSQMQRLETYAISMSGGFDSLNVATTTGIALYLSTRV